MTEYITSKVHYCNQPALSEKIPVMTITADTTLEIQGRQIELDVDEMTILNALLEHRASELQYGQFASLGFPRRPRRTSTTKAFRTTIKRLKSGLIYNEANLINVNAPNGPGSTTYQLVGSLLVKDMREPTEMQYNVGH